MFYESTRLKLTHNLSKGSPINYVRLLKLWKMTPLFLYACDLTPSHMVPRSGPIHSHLPYVQYSVTLTTSTHLHTAYTIPITPCHSFYPPFSLLFPLTFPAYIMHGCLPILIHIKGSRHILPCDKSLCFVPKLSDIRTEQSSAKTTTGQCLSAHYPSSELW